MIVQNQILNVCLIAWLLAQLIKFFLVLLREKKLNFRRLIETGGMPSSHSALVVSLATSVGKAEGFDSVIFAIATVFALIVMYDASGVRRAAGKQARVLNRLIEELYKDKPRVDEKLKELLGHTPVEVFAGALLGIVIGLVF